MGPGLEEAAVIFTTSCRNDSDGPSGQTIAFARWRSQPPLALQPGFDYAGYAVDPAGHRIQMYYHMEQIGWDGKPQPAYQRRKAAPVDMWTESPETLSGTYADQTFLGPLG